MPFYGYLVFHLTTFFLKKMQMITELLILSIEMKGIDNCHSKSVVGTLISNALKQLL